MTTADLLLFKDNLRARLEERPILAELEQKIKSRSSSAGSRREEVFTREFLCPAIAQYFRDLGLNLSPEEVQCGLGTEGFQNCPGFGFTPASSFEYVFTKSDVIAANPPATWFKTSARPLPPFQACPDFAVTQPLPFSLVGEVKFVQKPLSPSAAVRELFNAARQALFYLGAFRQVYKESLIVIADASPGHTFFRGLDEVRPELLRRFGHGSGIHFVAVKLH